MNIFIGRTDVEAETPILWPPDTKSWLIWKDPDAGKHWGQEEKGMTEDEMIGWHHQLNGNGFEWTPEVGDGQGGLACCSSWGCKESDMTEWLNCVTEKYKYYHCFQEAYTPNTNNGRNHIKLVLIIFEMWVKFSSDTIWVWRFIWGELLNYKYNLLKGKIQFRLSIWSKLNFDRL